MLSYQSNPCTFLIVAVFCFLLGLFISDQARSCSSYLPQAPELIGNSLEEDYSLTQKGDHFEDPLNDIVSDKFSCNARSAYEELTRLHFRRVNLDEHRKKGDANRARIATIQRKATAADAAEGAFRSCVNLVLPELLTEWDEKLAKKAITSRKTWDDRAEESHHGITLDVLKETADAIEETT